MPLSPTEPKRALPAAQNTGAPTAGAVELIAGPSAFKRLPVTTDSTAPIDDSQPNKQDEALQQPLPPPPVALTRRSDVSSTQGPTKEGARPAHKAGPQPENVFHAIWDKIHERFTWKTQAERQQQQVNIFDGMQMKQRPHQGGAPKAAPAATAGDSGGKEAAAEKKKQNVSKNVVANAPRTTAQSTAAGRAEALASAVRRARLNHRQARAEAMRREAQFWSATARAEREFDASKAVLDGVERALYARITGGADAPVEVVPIPLPPPFPGAAMQHAALMVQHPDTLHQAERSGFGFVSALRAAPAHAKSAIGAAPAVVEAKSKFERAHSALREGRIKASTRAAKFANTQLAFQRLEEQAMDDLTKEAEFAFCDSQACPDGHVDLCTRCDGTPSVFIGSRGPGDRDAAGAAAADAHDRRLHHRDEPAESHSATEGARVPVRNAPLPPAAAAAGGHDEEPENNLDAAEEKELPTSVTVYQAIIRSRAAEADVDRVTAVLALAHQAARTRTETAKQQLETALISLDAASISPGDSGVLVLPTEADTATTKHQPPSSGKPQQQKQQEGGKHVALQRPTEVASIGAIAEDDGSGKQKKQQATTATRQETGQVNADLETRLRRVAELSANLDGLRAQNEQEIHRAQVQLNKALDARRDAQTKLRTILTGASLRSILPTKAWFRSWFVKPEDDAEVRADLLRRRVAAAAERVMDAAQMERSYAQEFQVDASSDAYDVAHAEEDLRDAERELASAVEAEVKRLQHNAALGAAGARPDELEEIATPNYDKSLPDPAAAAAQAAGNPIKAAGWFRGRFPSLAERTEAPDVEGQFKGRDVAFLGASRAPTTTTATTGASTGAKYSSPSSSAEEDEEGEFVYVPVVPQGAARPLLPQAQLNQQPQRQPRPPTPVNVNRQQEERDGAAAPEDDQDRDTTSASSAQLLGRGHVTHAGNERQLGDRAVPLPRDELTSPPPSAERPLPSHTPISTDALLLRFVDALKAKRAAEGRLRATQDSQQAARAAAWSALRTSDSELAWALRNLSQWQTWHPL